MSNRDFRELIANGTPEEIAAEIMIFRRTASNEGFHKLLVMALTGAMARELHPHGFTSALEPLPQGEGEWLIMVRGKHKWMSKAQGSYLAWR